MPQSAARFLYHLQFLLGLAGCTALRLRRRTRVGRHNTTSSLQCSPLSLCKADSRIDNVHAVNGSQYVCALPQSDTTQCYHTVRPRDYLPPESDLAYSMYVLLIVGMQCRTAYCYRVLNEQINPSAKAAFQSVATQQQTMFTGLGSEYLTRNASPIALGAE